MKLWLVFNLYGIFLTINLGSCKREKIISFLNSQSELFGLVFPHEIHMQAGHDVRATMLKSMVNQDRCILRTPEFIDIDFNDKHDERYEKWGKGCGAKIKNITKADEGRWQLISAKGNNNLQGIFTVIIQDPNAVFINNNKFDFVEGDMIQNISFLNPHSQYCTITHAKMKEIMVAHGDCVYPVMEGRINRKMQGKWLLGVGMAGSIEEMIVEKEVNVRIEDLDIGFEDDPNGRAVHIYCNLKNSLKRIEFCRFERTQDMKAFNLNDGLGKGRYSYYGKGIFMNDCGLTIMDPSELDYGSWRCTVGFARNADNATSVMRGAMLIKAPASRHIKTSEFVGKSTILSVEGRPLTVVCNAGVSIIYCSLHHPNGTLILRNRTNTAYEFNNGNLNIGQCELTIFEGSITDNGDWTCYMGLKKAGLEMTETVSVRVGGALAAVEKSIWANKNDSVTIHCVTAGGNEELNYCRFLTPEGIPFHIDNGITEENAIQGEYYYPENLDLYTGDCAVTITHLRSAHFGKWTCLAMIKNEDVEYMDTITVVANSNDNKLSTASATGIGVGVSLVIIITLMGVVMWRRQSLPCWRRPGRPTEVELQPPRSSGESEDSVAIRLNVNPTRQTTYGVQSSQQVTTH